MDGELTPSEQAFFESGGQTEIVQTLVEPTPDAPQVDSAAPSDQPQADQQQDRDEKGRFVPHQALHAEREEHKKTRSELQAIREKQAILEDRWNTLLKAREATQEPEKGPPDPETDIFGYVKWQNEKLAALENQQAERQKQEEQYRQQTQADQEIVSYWQSAVQEYSAATPDFTDAAKWLSDFRHKQLEALAPIDERMANPAARNAQIDAELKQIIATARQRGENPATMVHKLAEGWGYKKAAPAATQSPPALPDKLATIEAAQEAARTVGQAPGRSGSDALTPESIAQMSAADFERWSSDPKNAKLLDRMLGA